MKSGKPTIIVIVGPTASGKSDLAIQIAHKYNGEIISADSRQVYRGMDIGTGKVTKKEQKMAKHHLLDVVSPKKVFTVTDFKRLGEKALAQILKKGKLPVIVGGTGFYIDALVYGQELPEVPPNQKFRAKLEKLPAEQLFARLMEVDPQRGSEIGPANKRKIIRALEIISVLGKVPKIKQHSKYNIIWIGINPGKEILAERIKKRLYQRLRQGMVAEVRKLIAAEVSHTRLFKLGLEYRWVGMYLENKITKEEMKNGLYQAILHYSKKQMTWFKRNKEINWQSNNDCPESLMLG